MWLRSQDSGSTHLASFHVPLKKPCILCSYAVFPLWALFLSHSIPSFPSFCTFEFALFSSLPAFDLLVRHSQTYTTLHAARSTHAAQHAPTLALCLADHGCRGLVCLDSLGPSSSWHGRNLDVFSSRRRHFRIFFVDSLQQLAIAVQQGVQQCHSHGCAQRRLPSR